MERITGERPVVFQCQENLVEPLEGPQEGDDSDPFEEEKQESTFSGFCPSQ
jgi:hypothetical protein